VSLFNSSFLLFSQKHVLKLLPPLTKGRGGSGRRYILGNQQLGQQYRELFGKFKAVLQEPVELLGLLTVGNQR
jgi:hypothetical protein